MAYADVLRAMRAIFLERPSTPQQRAAIVDREGSGLSPAERATLLGAPAKHLDVYAGLVRDTQQFMLRFAAPATVSAAQRFLGIPEPEFAERVLVESPRRSSSIRELGTRLLEHLQGPGTPWTERCPPLLDLARMERCQMDVFYGPDEDEALSPPAFAERVAASTVDDVLALLWRRPRAFAVAALDHDVLDWRAAWLESKAWPDLPPRLEAPLEAVCARDPESLQPWWHRVEPRLLGCLRAPGSDGWAPLEGLAASWVEATGASGDDPEVFGQFVEQIATWVRWGLIVVRSPARPAA